ncbi:transcription antiterminator [Bacillus timonensis]|nr:transcription antiterminator [Bacillus timonensis]
MGNSFLIKKILNNNVLIASHTAFKEVVLIGKGIGFGKKTGEVITSDSAEKMFVLENENAQEQYKKLIGSLDDKILDVMNDVIQLIKERVHAPLNEHIHIALTDHIAFAVRRIKEGMDLKNPFLLETKSLYAMEYQIAEEVVSLLNESLGITLPEGEVGFIALHIHSARSNNSISEVNQHSQLIHTLIQMIEDHLKLNIDRESIHYVRLVRHLHFTIDRAKNGEKVEEPKKLSLLLKEEYPVCYNLSWKVVKVMQQSLKLAVSDAEAVYLTMHLQRLSQKNN